MKIIHVNNKDDFKKAIEDNSLNFSSLTFISSSHSIYYLGLAYLWEMFNYIQALYPNNKINFIVDCHDDGGIAYAALKMGFKNIMIDNKEELTGRLISIATKTNANIDIKPLFFKQIVEKASL